MNKLQGAYLRLKYRKSSLLHYQDILANPPKTGSFFKEPKWKDFYIKRCQDLQLEIDGIEQEIISMTAEKTVCDFPGPTKL